MTNKGWQILFKDDNASISHKEAKLQIFIEQTGPTIVH